MNKLICCFSRQIPVSARLYQQTNFRGYHTSSTSAKISGLVQAICEKSNKFRVLGSLLGLTGVSTLAFDKYYNQITKSDLDKFESSLHHDIEKLGAKIDGKIDGLRDAIIQVVLGESSVKTENRKLREENAELNNRLSEK